MFFPVFVTGTGARQAEAAKMVCGGCGVRADCLSYALETMPEGIWGGTTQQERRAARSYSVRRASAQSRGTLAAAAADELAVQAGHAARRRWTA